MVDVSSGRKVKKFLPALNRPKKNFFNTTLEDVYREKYGGRMPLLTENVATGIGTGLKAIGVPKYRAEDVGRRVTHLATDWTPLGALPAVEKGGLLGTGLGVLAAVPIVGGKAGKAVKAVEEILPEPGGLLAGIKGYHGSPHSFPAEPGAPLGRFRDTAIGTGEGAQAYGHGHYLAESEGVARSYRDALSGGKRGVDPPKFRSLGRELRHVGPDDAHDIAEGGMPALDARMDKVRQTIKEIRSGETIYGKEQVDQATGWYERELNELAELKATGDVTPTSGHMYEVNIAADPEHFLDWDKPIAEQPHVQEAMPKLGFQPAPFPYSGWLGEKLIGEKDYPETLLRGLGEKGVGEQRLKQAGIPGIKYLDQGSRRQWFLDGKPIADKDYVAQAAADAMGTYARKEDAIKALSQHPGYKNTNKDAVELLKSGRITQEGGTRNFVVFDPAIINIVRKYGLAAAIGAGIVSEEMGRQMQAQGEI